MTRRTNARVAGSAFLLYVALGIPSLILTNRATSAPDLAGKLASIAQHATDVRVAIVLILFSAFCALTLGVTLYALTRDQDQDIAMLAMTFRVCEGVVGALSTQDWQKLLWLATATGPSAPDTRSSHALAAYVLYGGGGAAMFFAVGSLLFCWLLLRGRIIPTALAWIGVIASALWVATLPFRAAGVDLGSAIQLITWIPMAVFEIPFALWLIFKGAAAPVRAPAA